MENLSLLRKRRSLAVLLALAVLVTYSLPMSIFADTGETGSKQQKAEVVQGGGTLVYDKAGNLLDGVTDLSGSPGAFISVSKKITKDPTDADPNKFEVTTEVKAKPEATVEHENEDTAVALVLDVSCELDYGKYGYSHESQYKDRKHPAKEKILEFLDNYAKSANGKKRMLSFTYFAGGAGIVKFSGGKRWIDVSDSESLKEAKNYIQAYIYNEPWFISGTFTQTGRMFKLGEEMYANIEAGLYIAQKYAIQDDEISYITDKKNKHTVLVTAGFPTGRLRLGTNQGGGEKIIVADSKDIDFITFVEDNKGVNGNLLYEAYVDDIPKYVEKINETTNSHIVLYTNMVDEYVPIMQNKILPAYAPSNCKIRDRFDFIGLDKTREYLERNKDRSLNVANNPLPKGLILPKYGKKSINDFGWESDKYEKGLPMGEWYSKYSKFEEVYEAPQKEELAEAFAKINKSINHVDESQTLCELQDDMGDFVDFVDGETLKSEHKIKAEFVAARQKSSAASEPVTLYTNTYNVVLNTEKDGFVDSAEYAIGKNSVLKYKLPDESNAIELKLPELKVKGYLPEIPYNIKYHFVNRDGTETVESTQVNWGKLGDKIKLSDLSPKYTEEKYQRNGKNYLFKSQETEGTLIGNALYSLDVYYMEEAANIKIKHYFVGTVIDEDGNTATYTEENPYTKPELNIDKVVNNSQILTPAADRYYIGDKVTVVTKEKEFGRDVKFTHMRIGKNTSQSTTKKLEAKDNTIELYYKGTIDEGEKTSLKINTVFVDYEYKKNSEGKYVEFEKNRTPEILNFSLLNAKVNGNNKNWIIDIDKLYKADEKENFYRFAGCEGGISGLVKEIDNAGKPALEIDAVKLDAGKLNEFTVKFERKWAEPKRVKITVNHHYTFREGVAIDGVPSIRGTENTKTVETEAYVGEVFKPELITLNEKDGLTYEYRPEAVDASLPVVLTKELLAENKGEYETTLNYELGYGLQKTSVTVNHHYQSKEILTNEDGEVSKGELKDDETSYSETFDKVSVLGEEDYLYVGQMYLATLKLKDGYVLNTSKIKTKKDIEKELVKDASENVIDIYYIKKEDAEAVSNSVEVRHIYITKVRDIEDSATLRFASSPILRDEEKDIKDGLTVGETFTVTPQIKYQQSDKKKGIDAWSDNNYCVKSIEGTDEYYENLNSSPYGVNPPPANSLVVTVKPGQNYVNIFYETHPRYEDLYKWSGATAADDCWKKVLGINEDTHQLELQDMVIEGRKINLAAKILHSVLAKIGDIAEIGMFGSVGVGVGDRLKIEDREQKFIPLEEGEIQTYNPVSHKISYGDKVLKPNDTAITLDYYVPDGNFVILNYTRLDDSKLTKVKFNEKHEFYVQEIDSEGNLKERKPEKTVDRNLPAGTDENLYLGEQVNTLGTYGGYKTTSVRLNGNEISADGDGYTIDEAKNMQIVLKDSTVPDENGERVATLVYEHERKEYVESSLELNCFVRELDWKGKEKTGRDDLDEDNFYKHTVSGKIGVLEGMNYSLNILPDMTLEKAVYNGKELSKDTSHVVIKKGENVLNVYYEKKDKYGTPLADGEKVKITHIYKDDKGLETLWVDEEFVSGVENGVWLDNKFNVEPYKKSKKIEDGKHKGNYQFEKMDPANGLTIKATGNEIALEYWAKDDPAEKKDDESEKPKKKHKSSTSSNSNGAGTSNKGDKGTPENGGKTENTENTEAPSVDIDDNEVPLATAPELVDIADTPVPLANKIVELIDEEVPLGALPYTGGYGVAAVVGLGGLLAMAGILLGRKKKGKVQ